MHRISCLALLVSLLVGFQACQGQKSATSASSQKQQKDQPTALDTCQQKLEKAQTKSSRLEDKLGRMEKPYDYKPEHPYRAEEPRRMDLLHTSLSVSFDWQNQYLNGIAELTFSPWFYPQDSVVLDARGFDLHKVELISGKNTQSLSYDYRDPRLHIALDRSYQRDEKLQIRIDYTAKPNELPEGGSSAIHSDKGLYFIDPLDKDPDKPSQIWTQGETHASRAWFPTMDQPNEKMTQKICMTVKDEYITLSNGAKISSEKAEEGMRTDCWEQKKPHAPYLTMMAVGDFAKVEDQWRGMPVNYYVEPEYREHARAIFGNTPEMLTFFSEKMGYEYPWAKYSQIVVREFVSGAMENTSASVFMDALNSTKRELLDKDWDYIIAHELSHHWFGDLVTCESWSNLPLNEAFADYSEYLWAEHHNGRDDADLMRQDKYRQYKYEVRSKKRVPMIRYHYADEMDMFDAHSYNKGGLTLHMLRKHVGDEAFFAALSRYLHQLEYGKAELAQLRIAFEETVGKDMNWFFDQWFRNAGHPRLKVTKETGQGPTRLTVRQLQDTATTPIYRLPIEVELWKDGQKTTRQIWVEEQKQTFTFDSPQNPDLVYFDAENQLLGEISYQQSSEEYIRQFRYKKDLGIARLEALRSLESEVVGNPKAQQVALEALADPFWKVRSKALSMLKVVEDTEGLDTDQPLPEKVAAMALKDPKPHVRVAALEYLELRQPEQHLATFEKALADSSYSVMTKALKLYLSSAGEEAKEVLDQYRNTSKPQITLALASYYADQGDASDMSWYMNKLEELKGQQLASFIDHFGVYINRQPKALQEKARKKLTSIAREHPATDPKVYAFKVLGMLDKLEGIEQLQRQLIKAEEDEKALQYFELFGPGDEQ